MSTWKTLMEKMRHLKQNATQHGAFRQHRMGCLPPTRCQQVEMSNISSRRTRHTSCDFIKTAGTGARRGNGRIRGKEKDTAIPAETSQKSVFACHYSYFCNTTGSIGSMPGCTATPSRTRSSQLHNQHRREKRGLNPNASINMTKQHTANETIGS